MTLILTCHAMRCRLNILCKSLEVATASQIYVSQAVVCFYNANNFPVMLGRLSGLNEY